MNHLAHLFLSQSDVNLFIGNFIADQVRGKQIESFSLEIQKGIEMHRKIDSFTDKHTTVQQSKTRLYPNYHKYAAVIVDMYYDHFLAKNWRDYSPISLTSFSATAYKILNLHQELMPSRSQRILYYMAKQNWLNSYASFEGLQQAMNGLADRAKFNSKMENSISDLQKDYSIYEEEFRNFFKDLFQYNHSLMEQLK